MINEEQEQFEKEREEFENLYGLLSLAIVDNFIERYRNYASPLTDAPKEFHILAAESILSIISDKKAIIEDPADGPTHLNTYLMIIAYSGAGKTSAFGIYDETIKALGFEDKKLPRDVTPETFFREFSEQSHRFYAHDEYSEFLTSKEKNYNKGLINRIIDYYGCPDERSASRGGTRKQKDEFGNEIDNIITAKDIFFNQLVMMQDQPFVEFIGSKEVGIGFPQRFQIIFCKSQLKRARRNQTPEDITKRTEAIEYAKVIISNLEKCNIYFSNELHQYIFEKVEKYYDNILQKDKLLKTFPRRFAEQIYKLSGLLAIDRICSKQKSGIQIDIIKSDIDTAFIYLSKSCFDSTIEFMQTNGIEHIKNRSDFDRVFSVATNHLTAKGKLSKTELTPLLNLVGQDLRIFYQQAFAEEKLIFTSEINPKTGKTIQFVSLPQPI